MEISVTLAAELDSLARTGTLDTLSLKQALERISSTTYDCYAHNATIAISTLEGKVQSLLKTYDEETVKHMLIRSLQTEPSLSMREIITPSF